MRVLLTIAAALLLLAEPAAAAPRVTLQLEDASFHVVCRRLQKLTGLQFRSQDGAGEEDYKDPPGGKKAKFNWKDASLGIVLREVCATFNLTAAAMGDSGYWFRTGPLPKRREVVHDGIAFSIPGITQSEVVTIVPGEKPRIQRNLQIRLVCRAESGDGDAIGPLTKLVLIDPRGRKHEAASPNAGFDQNYVLPDERVRSIFLSWDGEHPGRLARMEGEVSLFARVQEDKFLVPATGYSPEQARGTVKMKVNRLAVTGNRTNAGFRLEWPKETDVTLYGNNAIRVFLLGTGDRRERVYCGINSGEQAGVKWAQFDLSTQLDFAPSAVELVVPSRSGLGRKIPFVIEQIPLPFGEPLKVKTEPVGFRPRVSPLGLPRSARGIPAPYYDPEGGSVRLSWPQGRVDEEQSLIAVVGISRRETDGSWGPVRWIEVDASEDGARISWLSPGAYRLRLQYWLRGPVGAPVRLPLPERSAQVMIEAKKEVVPWQH